MNAFPETYTATQKRRLASTVLRPIIQGIIVFLVLVLVDQISVRMGLSGAQRFADDLLGGVIVAMISLLDERRRRRYLASRLRVIALMNHHVRNALQAIKYAHHTDQQVRLIDESVARIEWALREVLPGEMTQTQVRGAPRTQVSAPPR